MAEWAVLIRSIRIGIVRYIATVLIIRDFVMHDSPRHPYISRNILWNTRPLGHDLLENMLQNFSAYFVIGALRFLISTLP